MTTLPGGRTVEAARRNLAARFRSAGLESAELDARLLAGAVLGLDLTGMITAANRTLTAGETSTLEQFAQRRLASEPVARILGEKEFWGLSLRLSSATLVPRPDTEAVVELALEMLRVRAFPSEIETGSRQANASKQTAGASFQSDRNGKGSSGRSNYPLRIADLGTGSGALLLALLSELPGAEGFGTDISVDALQTAADNAARAGLAGRATFIACDYAAGLGGSFDLIVSNPPYIRSADIDGLGPEVRNHDPLAALDGGADGLDAYRSLIPQAARLLASGGVLVVEAGQGQTGDIEALMTSAGLTCESAPKADLAGILRAVAARRMPP